MRKKKRKSLCRTCLHFVDCSNPMKGQVDCELYVEKPVVKILFTIGKEKLKCVEKNRGYMPRTKWINDAIDIKLKREMK